MVIAKIRLERLENGIPQGSVLAPLLNIYISDLPTTASRKYAHADDLAIMHADGDWQSVEEVLSKGMCSHGRWILLGLQAKAQRYKNGAGNLPPRKQGS